MSVTPRGPMRPEGYYWVRYGTWEPALWTGGEWWMAGTDCPRSDADFGKIGQMLVAPSEATAPVEDAEPLVAPV